MKLAESLSPITNKLYDVIKESTQKLGDVIEKNNTPQLDIENTPQPAIENTQPQQPIENNEGGVYDVDLENTLNKMTENTGFFKTYYDKQQGWMMNNIPIKTSGGTNVKISDNKYNIFPGLQKVFTDTKYETAKSMSDMEKVVFRDMLLKTGYYNRKPTKGKTSSRDRYIKNDLNNDVRRILD